MSHDLLELLTYYVIVAVVFVGAPGVFLFIVFMLLSRIQKDVWLDIKIIRHMVIHPLTRIHLVITPNTPYKLADIIRDTWPQLYYLKVKNNGRFNNKSTTKGVV